MLFFRVLWPVGIATDGMCLRPCRAALAHNPSITFGPLHDSLNHPERVTAESRRSNSFPPPGHQLTDVSLASSLMNKETLENGCIKPWRLPWRHRTVLNPPVVDRMNLPSASAGQVFAIIAVMACMITDRAFLGKTVKGPTRRCACCETVCMKKEPGSSLFWSTYFPSVQGCLGDLPYFKTHTQVSF